MKNLILLLTDTALAGFVGLAFAANEKNIDLEPVKTDSAEIAVVNLPSKPLDLTVPFTTSAEKYYSDQAYTDKVLVQKPGIFDQQQASKTKTLELDGHVLMTQEQEVEKRRTLDGAGIMINVRQ
jgi:hypothetical protein